MANMIYRFTERMMMFILFLIVLQSCIFPQLLFSKEIYYPQISDPIREPWRWHSFPELSGQGVRCMTEAWDGSMWFGIDNGVVQYDGLTWTYYSSEFLALNN